MAALSDLESEKKSLLMERISAADANERLVVEMTALHNRIEVLARDKAQLQAEVERLGTSASQSAEAAKATSAALQAARVKHQAEVERIRGQWEGNEKRWFETMLAKEREARIAAEAASRATADMMQKLGAQSRTIRKPGRPRGIAVKGPAQSSRG